MDILRTLALGAIWFCLIFWVEAFRLQVRAARRIPRLREVQPQVWSVEGPAPRLAVVVPARDEGSRLEACLESLLSQDYPNLVVVAVDDRSTDRSGEAMDRAAARDSRVHPIHITQLPRGWLGKNHANWLGWKRARELGAEWVLFTDGDVRFGEGTLSRAITLCLRLRLDHLTVFPRLLPGGLGETLFVAGFLLWFSVRFQPGEVGRRGSRRFLGLGAFNLVRRGAYEAVGTHAALRLTVADDMALGKLLQQAGCASRVADGRDLVSLRWYEGLGSALRGLHKNAFASMQFSLPVTLLSAAGLLLMNGLPWLAPWLTHGPTRAAAMAALALLCLCYYQSARALGRPRHVSLVVALLNGLAGLMFAWVLVSSAAVTLRQGGVRWRDTLYPLEELRSAQVRL